MEAWLFAIRSIYLLHDRLNWLPPPSNVIGFPFAPGAALRVLEIATRPPSSLFTFGTVLSRYNRNRRRERRRKRKTTSIWRRGISKSICIFLREKKKEEDDSKIIGEKIVGKRCFEEELYCDLLQFCFEKERSRREKIHGWKVNYIRSSKYQIFVAMSNVWIDRIFIENTGEKLIHFSEDAFCQSGFADSRGTF